MGEHIIRPLYLNLPTEMNPDAQHLTICLSSEDLQDLLHGRKDEIKWSLLSVEKNDIEVTIIKQEYEDEVQ